MKLWLFAVLAGALLFVGCGTRDRTEGFQQEKLLLDLIKIQSDQLAQLMQKENDLRSLEKRNQEALQEIVRQRAALQRLEQETAHKDGVAQEAIAQEKAKLENERDGLEVEKKRVRADELKNQANEQGLIAQRKELSRLRASLPPKRPVEIQGAYDSKRAQEEKSHAEIIARVKRRQPYLEELAAVTANLFESSVEHGKVRKEVLDLLAQSKVAEMKEDAAFADGALAVAESFYLNRNKYPYMIFSERKAFDQWRQKYLNAKATVAMVYQGVPFTASTER